MLKGEQINQDLLARYEKSSGDSQPTCGIFLVGLTIDIHTFSIWITETRQTARRYYLSNSSCIPFQQGALLRWERTAQAVQ